MNYEFDERAAEEAAGHQLKPQAILSLRESVDAKRRQLGPLGVQGHSIEYDVDSWSGLLSPEVFGAMQGRISRGDVFEIAQSGNVIDTFTASFLWGNGRRGYGPHRYIEIVRDSSGRLGELLAAAMRVSKQDLIAGYEMFFGGPDQKRRTAPMTSPWARLAHYGPAFFTKLLYFTHPDALILDNVLANAVSKLTGMPYLVNSKGQSCNWSSYRYAVYLHWMRLTASQLNCAPEELELTLFSPPRPLPI